MIGGEATTHFFTQKLFIVQKEKNLNTEQELDIFMRSFFTKLNHNHY